MDPGCAPSGILSRHLSNDLSNLLGRHRPTAARAGTPPPVEPEAGTAPAGDRLGLDDDQDALPTRPEEGQSEPEEAAEGVQGRTRSLASPHSDLLQEREDLEGGIASNAEEGTEHGEDGEDELRHELILLNMA